MEYHQVPEGTTTKWVNYANHFYLKLFKTTLFSNKIFHPPIEPFLKTSKTSQPSSPLQPLTEQIGEVSTSRSYSGKVASFEI